MHSATTPKILPLRPLGTPEQDQQSCAGEPPKRSLDEQLRIRARLERQLAELQQEARDGDA
jgi:hypothetical protein